MRVNIYSHGEPELGRAQSNTGVGYWFVRLPLHSSPKLHHPPMDDDRSAVTFWLPKSVERREVLATIFEEMGRLIRMAPAETGMD